MSKRLVLYALREIRERTAAFLTLFTVMTVSCFVLFNMLFFSYGSQLALIERAAEKYHIRIYFLTQSEADSVRKLPYAESVRSYPQNDGTVIAYVRLTDPSARTLKRDCWRIVRDLGLTNKPQYVKYHITGAGSVPDFWTNREYYNLASAPHIVQVLPTLGLIFLLSLTSILFSLHVKAVRTQKEYGLMLALGMTRGKVSLMTALQTLFLAVCSLLAALVPAIPLLKLVSVFTKHAYGASYPGVIFALPWTDIGIVSLSFLLTVTVFQIILTRRLLSREVTALIREENTVRLPYVLRSSGAILSEDAIRAYGKLYTRRTVRTRLLTLAKAVALFALPTILLLLSISFNEGRAFSDNRDFWLSPSEGKLTESDLEKIAASPFVDTVTRGKWSDSGGTYIYAEIYCVKGCEEECSEMLEQFADSSGLLFTDFIRQKRTLKAQADFFAPYYLFQSLMMFLCGLLIIGEDLRYELRTRREEFAVIRAIGYPAEEVKTLLAPYALFGIAGFAAGILVTFLFMGSVFSIWVSELLLYPFVIISCFGLLDFLLHRRICRRYVSALQREEISGILCGRE